MDPILLPIASVVLLVVAVVAVALAVTAARRTAAAARDLESRIARLEADLAAERDARAAAEAEARRRLETAERAPRVEAVPVITRLGELEAARERAAARSSDGTTVRLTAPAFADAVLRETVVHTAAWVHGVRRAVSPQTLDRVRGEMRREVKRSRKARKVEVRAALREYRARHRRDVEPDVADDLTNGGMSA